MKVAVFHNLQSGGAKRSLFNLTKYLVEAGHLVDAFIPGSADEEFLSMKGVAHGYRIFPVQRTLLGTASALLRRISQLSSSWVDLEKTQKFIAEAINAASYDVVLCEQDSGTVSPFILKFLTKPVLYYCQQPDRSQDAILDAVSSSANGCSARRNRYLSRKANQLDKDNARFASYIVTNSCFSREAILRAYGLNASVSYLGTDINLFQPRQESREEYVLSVGSCSPDKGFDFIIRSLGLMEPSLRPKMVVVANVSVPQWEVHLVRLATRLKVSLDIKKNISDSELVRLYNRAKLFVYAPYLEPFGLVVLEAMACGTPVIGVREGGIRESVVHNESGILVERDEQAFAQAVSEILQDDLQWRRLTRRALEMVRRFWTWQHAGQRLEGHLIRASALRQE